jgi:hypothetical protein
MAVLIEESFMSVVAEVTKLSLSIVDKLPILKGIHTTEEHEQALVLMERLLKD